jgi:hypothetical protein
MARGTAACREGMEGKQKANVNTMHTNNNMQDNIQ